MKTRLLSGFVVVLAIVFSVAIASDKGEKTAKAPAAKKEMKSCCSEMKDAKDCSDKDMKDCDTKDAKASKKSAGTKSETKTETKAGDAK